MFNGISQPPDANGIIWSIDQPKHEVVYSRVTGHGNTFAKLVRDDWLLFITPDAYLAGSHSNAHHQLPRENQEWAVVQTHWNIKESMLGVFWPYFIPQNDEQTYHIDDIIHQQRPILFWPNIQYGEDFTKKPHYQKGPRKTFTMLIVPGFKRLRDATNRKKKAADPA